MVAAGKTLDKNKPFIVHSLHSYFIRPGNDNIPILYSVDRTRDGQSFCTRRVIAIQNGKTIFSMDVSFHVNEPGLSHQYKIINNLPSPDTLEDWNIVRNRYSNDTRFTKSFRQFVSTSPVQMSIRKIIPSDLHEFLQPQRPYSLWYVKASHTLPNDYMSHCTALSYMSDAAFLETACLPHGTYWASATLHDDNKPVINAASIDHAMWFHSYFRADQWLLYECETPVASGGRGLVIGRFYTLEGKLVVSTMQEAYFHINDWDTVKETEKHKNRAKL